MTNASGMAMLQEAVTAGEKVVDHLTEIYMLKCQFRTAIQMIVVDQGANNDLAYSAITLMMSDIVVLTAQNTGIPLDFCKSTLFDQISHWVEVEKSAQV